MSGFGNRIFYLFFAVAPFLGWLNPTVLIAVSVAMAVPGALLNIVWRIFSLSCFQLSEEPVYWGIGTLIKVVSIFATFGGGYFLAVVGYLRNYSVLFGLTFIACMISVYLITSNR